MSEETYAISWYDIPYESQKLIWQRANLDFNDQLEYHRLPLWMLNQGAEKLSQGYRNNKNMYIFSSKERYVEFILKWM